jgi:hypothetical protein
MGDIGRIISHQQVLCKDYILERNSLPSQGIAFAWEYPSLVGVPLVVPLHECTDMTYGHTSHAKNLGKPFDKKSINQQTQLLPSSKHMKC